jgi:hypothetical protein
MSEHREPAEQSLESAQRKPIMSAGEQFAVAQVHVLGAIVLLTVEQRLDELVHQLRPRTVRQIERILLVPSEAA